MFKHPSIARNLTFSLGLTVLLVGFFCLLVYHLFESSKIKTRLENSGSEYANMLQSTLAFPLWNVDNESISVTSRAYSTNAEIIYLRVKDSGGKELFLYDHKEFYDCDWQRSLPIQYGKENVGNIEMCLTGFYLKKQNNQTLFLSSFIIILCFFTIIGLTRFFLQRFLRDPLIVLKQITHEYATGNFKTDILKPAHIEFRELITLLSQMGATIDQQMSSLKVAEEKLKKHSDHLEEIVEERTKELITNERRLQTILKTSPVGIGLVVKRRLDWANDTMYTMLGYQPGTLLGKSAKILYLDEEEFERVGYEFQRSIETDQIVTIETQWLHRDGHLIDCQLRALKLDKEDPGQGIIVAVTEMTESNRLKQKLLRSEKMEALGTLAGGVAHDLNNILSGIVSYPEILLLDLKEDDPLYQPLSTIKKSGERAVKIVQDLLTMTRRGVSVFEVTELNTIVIEQLTSPEIEQLLKYHPGLEVKHDLAEDLLNIKGSPTHLAKSIMNLISNGAEAIGNTGGTITIKTGNCHFDRPWYGYEEIPEGDFAFLTVTDTGSGIAKQDMLKIFEPFYTKKSMGRSGTGLGMAVVWGTVKDHNGFIDIQSSVGEGTTFSIYLPVTQEKLIDSEDQFELVENVGNGEHILIVDDVDTQREIARAMLEKLGYRVSVVASGEDAIQYLQNSSADLLLLDMIMDPGMDGLDTYRKILSMNPRQKAIVASGFSQTSRVRKILALGAGAYIKKPYTIKNLSQTIKDVLETGSSSKS